jgi:ribonuclease HI
MAFYIFIDSCTKRTAKDNKYGESTSAWGVWGDDLENPLRCGIQYFRYEGPNKCFYKGIIRALEQCLDLCWGDSVMILGDCEAVIKQLNGEWAVRSMAVEYNQVQALIGKYLKKENLVTFQYISENDRIYKKIDQLSKRSLNFIKKIIQ